MTRYWLYVGSTPGGADLWSQDQGTNLSTTVSGLPIDGRTLYVRLYSVIGGVWSFNDYTYTAAGTPPAVAELLSPAPGSTLRATTATFEWTGGIGVSHAVPASGDVAGRRRAVQRGPGATSLRATVAGLPSNGSPGVCAALVVGQRRVAVPRRDVHGGDRRLGESGADESGAAVDADGDLAGVRVDGRAECHAVLAACREHAGRGRSVQSGPGHEPADDGRRGCRPTGARCMCGCGR